MVKINGKTTDSVGMSMEEYLLKNDYDVNRVAVEINLSILPKSKYPITLIKDGDVIEIVGFVGGG